MAQIRNLDEQKKALQSIKNLIKSIRTVNTFLSAAAPEDGLYDIAIGGSHKTKMFLEDKQSIDELVRRYKQTLVSEIQQLTKEYDIILDEDDMNTISF